MDLMAEAMAKSSEVKPTTLEEREQHKVDYYNSMVGNLNEQDGFNCDTCKNKGLIMVLKDGYPVTRSCKCNKTRRSIMNMKRSGLESMIKDYTFERFEAVEPWQQKIKEAAMEYAASPQGWFFIGGQSGCGKTHLCTAICRQLLLDYKQVIYMRWRDEINKLKAIVNDNAAYEAEIRRYKTAEVLYIDDLFKTGKTDEGAKQKPTTADINAAFEILNYRYGKPELLTIISSECCMDDILAIDEAVGGRIYERTKRTFSIKADRSKNHRLCSREEL